MTPTEIKALQDLNLKLAAEVERYKKALEYIATGKLGTIPWMIIARNALSTPNPGAELLAELKNSLKECRKALEAQIKWHEEYDEYGGWPDSDLCVLTYAALKSILAINAAREGKEQND